MSAPIQQPAPARQAPATGATTGTLLRLHRVLWRRSFRKNPSQVFFAIFVVIYGLLGCLGLGGFIIDAASRADFRAMGLTLTAGTLMYWLITVMYPSGENQLEPGRIVTLPLSIRSITPGLMWAAVLQTRGILAVVNSLITFAFGTAALISAADRGALPAPLAVAIAGWAVAVVLALLVTIVGGEAIASLGSSVGTRTLKERLALVGSFAFIVLILGFNVLINMGVDANSLARLGTVLGWTPLGAAGGMGVSLAYGQWLYGAAQLVIAAGTIWVGWVTWRSGLASAMKKVAETSESNRTTRGTGKLLVPWTQNTVGGALYSRALRYWRRDTRFLYTIFTMPLLAVFFLLTGVFQGGGESAGGGIVGNQMFGAFLLATTGALNMCNDYGYDGPGNWVHIAAGVRGRTMVTARMAVSATVSAPFLMAYLAVLGAMAGFDGTWMLLAVTCVAGLLGGLGLGAYLSVANPFPTARPGTNPMKDRSGYSSGAFVTMLLVLVGVWVPMIPGIVMMNAGGGLFWAGAVLNLGLGIGGFFLGRQLAGKRLERRWPEVFAKVRNWT
ncbi:hypothetical protein CHEID_00230 [Corynebacterium heidelbergense]|uniref:hypothetical protein n=1 Tax=Corynebacterium heidelbergense TaxID=2055947 RepID=UPI002358269F|nr:hypothetical protein [Corynebacterium heidelbergense]WCZ35628.1 hypothetical protein CHEID_00230 [Corynebacterium heidelbergense]